MSTGQTSFGFHEFDREAGKRYAESGAKKAIDHAQLTDLTWAEQALKFLLQYIKHGNEFMVEELRTASIGTVPEPPSKRAWGGIIAKAARLGWVVAVGYRQVSNVKAHATPARVWKHNPN